MNQKQTSASDKLRRGAHLFAFLIALTVFSNVHAADHLDGPGVSSDPAADITDVYAWMQNGSLINLVMNVFPFASADSQFSDSVDYVFRVNSFASYGSEATESQIVCYFSDEELVTCKLNGRTLVENVDASVSGGVVSDDGLFRIYTGLRNDPFFFDLTNFNSVRTTVRDAAASLSFDEAGCPTVDSATQTALVNALVGAGGLPGTNSPAEDSFASGNILAIVVQAERGLFGSGPLYGVSASTHRK